MTINPLLREYCIKKQLPLGTVIGFLVALEENDNVTLDFLFNNLTQYKWSLINLGLIENNKSKYSIYIEDSNSNLFFDYLSKLEEEGIYDYQKDSDSERVFLNVINKIPNFNLEKMVKGTVEYYYDNDYAKKLTKFLNEESDTYYRKFMIEPITKIKSINELLFESSGESEEG